VRGESIEGGKGMWVRVVGEKGGHAVNGGGIGEWRGGAWRGE